MFCGRCGTALAGEAKLCSACGAPATVGGLPAEGRYGKGRLARPRTNRAVAGVCAGLAKHYGWELVWVRVLAVLLTVFSSGAGVVAYLVFWVVMPEEPWMLPAPASR